MSSEGLRILYADGGCNNGGQSRSIPSGMGAWAYVEKTDGGVATVRAGLVPDTTNNRTEMLAIIHGIQSAERGGRLRIFSDSGYVVTGWNNPNYLEKWLVNGWRTSKKDPVENQDLWRTLLALKGSYDFQLALIRGHGKDSNPEHCKWNNIVDAACTWMMHNAGIPHITAFMDFDMASNKPRMVNVKHGTIHPPFDEIDITYNFKI